MVCYDDAELKASTSAPSTPLGSALCTRAYHIAGNGSAKRRSTRRLSASHVPALWHVSTPHAFVCCPYHVTRGTSTSSCISWQRSH